LSKFSPDLARVANKTQPRMRIVAERIHNSLYKRSDQVAHREGIRTTGGSGIQVKAGLTGFLLH